MNRIALRSVRAHSVRFGLAILAVTLGVAFIAGTFSLRTLLSDTFESLVTGAADADAYVRGADRVPGYGMVAGRLEDVPGPVPLTLADKLRDTPGVNQVIPSVSGPLVLVGSNGTAVTTAGAPVMGLAVHPDDPVLNLIQGNLPTGADQIVLESSALNQAGLNVGDTTRIVIGDDIREVTVTGEVAFGGSLAGAILVGLDAETATTYYAPNGMVSELGIYATPGTTEEQLRAALTAQLTAAGETSTEVVTGDTRRDEVRESIDTMLGFIQVFLLVFAAVSLFVGGFLITNTFAMSVRERLREFALLRAIGASPAQVMTSILTQALVIGIIGSITGIAAGIGIAAGLAKLLAAVGMDLSGSVALTSETVIVSLTIGTILSIIAAAIPARRAARTAPVEAMRATLPGERRLLTRTLIGSPLALLGGAGVAFAGIWGDRFESGPLLGLAALTLVTGILVIAPVLARHVVRVLAVPFHLIGKPLGHLASGNVNRNPRRTANTAGALTIGMVLVAASGVVAASAQSSIDSVVRAELATDFLVQSGGALPEKVVQQITALPEAGRTEATHYQLGYVTGSEQPQPIVGVGPEFFNNALNADVVAGSVSTLNAGSAIISKEFADASGLGVGDELQITASTEAGRTGSAPVRVTGVVDLIAINASVFIPTNTLNQVLPDPELIALFVNRATGVDHETLRTEIAQIVEPYLVISVADQDDLSKQLADQVNGMLAVIYALLGLSIIIAVLGIVNTLALSVIERTREIALLRAVGLGRLQLATMIGMESVLTAVFGTLLGVGVGLAIAAAIPTVLADVGFTNLVIPWGQLVSMVGLAAIVGIIASLWPAIRAARLPVLDGLATE